MKYAPFTVPTLCRSGHFIRMIESLKRNTWAQYTDVIVSLDYPPAEKYRKGWEEIGQYIDNGDFSAFHDFIVLRQTKNLGSLKSDRLLKEYVLARYDRWIYCDDDCEFSPNFLEYMNKCLEAFEDDPEVVAVTGYSYPIDWEVSDAATCMKQQFNSATWGLGRWAKKYAPMADYIQSGQMLDDAATVMKTGRYRKMIGKCFSQYIHSAATERSGVTRSLMTGVTDLSQRAYLACQDKYCISPVLSKVRNYGFDGSGVFCQDSNGKDASKAQNYNYQEQPIDSSEHFDIKLNDVRWAESNRKRLDAFDHISKSSYWYAYIKGLLIRFLGIGFTRKADKAIVSVLRRSGTTKA